MFTVNYIVTQTDIDTKTTIVNTVTVTSDQKATDTDTDETVPTDKTADFAIEKEAILVNGNVITTETKLEIGDVVTYKITVTNTGSVTLTNVVVKDEMVGLEEIIANLSPKSNKEYIVTYTVTSQDIKNATTNIGVLTNLATAEYGDITKQDDIAIAVRTEYSYIVEYYYENTDGTITFEDKKFLKDEDKTEEIIATYGKNIAEYTDKNITGYTMYKAITTDFDGTLPLVVTEVLENNIIRVYYIKMNYNYKVQHYTQNIDGTWKLEDTDTVRDAIFGEKAIYEINSYTGFTFDSTKTENGDATVPANNDLVIKLYYTRNQYSYIVNYLEYGTNKELQEQKVVNNIPYGTIITSKNEVIDIAKYNYHSVDKNSLTIGDGTNSINIYYTAIVRTATVEEKSTSIRKTNLVLVLDLSSSMTQYGSSRLANAKTAAKDFIDQIYNDSNVSGINIKVVTFNSRNPIINSERCKKESHYEWIGKERKHKANGDSNEYDGCIKVDGTWYSNYETVAYSGTQVLSTTLTDDTATNYSEAQILKNAISSIYIPSSYQDSGYGTHIYAALQEANTQITDLSADYPNNDNVVVFLGDGSPTGTNYSGYEDNTSANIRDAGYTLQGNATVYCIRLGNEAQASTVFGYIASSTNKILDADTEGDLIDGFEAITSSENTRTYSKNSSNGVITIEADIDTTKPIQVTKPDGTLVRYNSLTDLNASGFITYDATTKVFTWDVLNYSIQTGLKISYEVK